MLRRLFASLLAMLVLALSCMPCGDAGTAPHSQSDGSETLAAPAQNPGDHRHDEGPDECSPFCACSCCAGFALPVKARFAVDQTNALSVKKPVALYRASVAPAVHLPIWQPPQLS